MDFKVVYQFPTIVITLPVRLWNEIFNKNSLAEGGGWLDRFKIMNIADFARDMHVLEIVGDQTYRPWSDSWQVVNDFANISNCETALTFRDANTAQELHRMFALHAEFKEDADLRVLAERLNTVITNAQR